MAGRVVSTRYISAVVSVPAGTARNAPQFTPIALGEVVLDEIRLTVPSGHFGLTGIQFRYAENPIVPWNDSNAYIIGNDLREPFTVNFEVSSPVEVVCWNVDTYEHSFYLRFQVSDLPSILPSQSIIVPIS